MNLGRWEAARLEGRTEKGRTRPIIVECLQRDGAVERRNVMVVKGPGHPEVTAMNLSNEFIGHVVADAFEAPTMPFAVVDVDADFIAANHEAFQRLGVMPVPGEAFGTERFENPQPLVVSKLAFSDDELREVAASYALDMALQNMDRKPDNPNCAFLPGHRLVLFDFDLACSFRLTIPSLLPAPWEVRRFGFQQNHLFFNCLRGQQVDWTFVPGVMTEIGDTCETWLEACPAQWVDGLDSVIAHFKALATHRLDFMSELSESLR